MKTLNVGWQGGRRETPLDVLIPVRRPWPDFPSLIPILQNLRCPLDTDTGEAVITSDESAKIRACGLEARAGRWRCPLLPDHLVRHLSVLWMLSDLYGPETRGERWHPKRAAVLAIIPPMDALSKFDWRLIERLQKAPGQRLNRAALKRRYWREGARFVGFTIDRLIDEDHITEEGGWLYPCRHRHTPDSLVF